MRKNELEKAVEEVLGVISTNGNNLSWDTITAIQKRLINAQKQNINKNTANNSRTKSVTYSELTDRVFIAKQAKGEAIVTSDKRDITSEFISMILCFVPNQKMRFISDGQKETILCNIGKTKEGIEAGIRRLKKILNKIDPQNDKEEKPNFVGAMAILKESLSADDSEGSYYHAWQANIAMAFKDEWQRRKDNIKEVSFTVDEVANQAAKNFLDMLCAKTQTPLDESEATPPQEEQSERSE